MTTDPLDTATPLPAEDTAAGPDMTAPVDAPLPPAEAPQDDPVPNSDELAQPDAGSVSDPAPAPDPEPEPEPEPDPGVAQFVASTPAPPEPAEEAQFQAEPNSAVAANDTMGGDNVATASPLPDDAVSTTVSVPAEPSSGTVPAIPDMPAATDSVSTSLDELKQDATEVADVHEIHEDLAELIRDAHVKVSEVHAMLSDIKATVDDLPNLVGNLMQNPAIAEHPLIKMLTRFL